MQQLRIFIAIFAALLMAPLALVKPVFAAVGAIATDDAAICARAIGVVEPASNVPLKLLDAVSVVESGRWDAARQARVAWPWTVYADGEGRFFATKRAAIDAVRRLQRRGVESIDVGCMQVNLFYHPKAFANLEEAFDPMANVIYATGFLNRLRQTTRSWTLAVAHYHSSDRARGGPYWQRVRVAWNEAVVRHYRQKREAHIKAYRERRAARLAARAASLALMRRPRAAR